MILYTHTHTHTHTRDLLTKKKRNKSKNRKGGEPIVIKLNLSLTIIKTILMIAIISLIMAQATLTIIKTNKQKALVANQESEEKVKYVASKKIDENRKEILDAENEPEDDTRKVPVPVGYTASQVPGERSIDTGFVIYEGDINWADYINKDDLYNSNINEEETQIRLKNDENETSINQWTLLKNGVYTSGYVDEVGNKYGNYNKDNVENKLISQEFILEKSDTLIIQWAVSSENVDKLYYTIKNTETGAVIGGEETAISGTTAGTNINELTYTDIEVNLEKGTYEIEFTYRKNDSNSEGLDAGFVKSIKKKPEYEVPEVKFTIPEGDGATEGNHHWLQYEDGTYVSGYVDETGKTYGNYHIPNSVNTLTSEEFTLEREALLKFDWSISAHQADYGMWFRYEDNLYYNIIDKSTGNEISRDEIGAIEFYGYKGYENLDFTSRTIKLSAGTYTVSFVYMKDNLYDQDLDAGFVKNIKLIDALELDINIGFYKNIYQGGEYEENVWSTGYEKDGKVYGNYHIDNSIGKLQTEEITILEKGVVLKFDWAVSSELSDSFSYKITNTKTKEIIVEKYTNQSEEIELKFEEKRVFLEPGTYIIEYIYEKDALGYKGLDAGFIKNIRTVQKFTQTELNIFNLQKNTNQYVWVPISEYELKEIYGVDKNGKIWGKLYDKDYNPTTTHSKLGLNWEILEDGTMNIISPIGCREPDVTRDLYKADLDSNLLETLTGETRYELLSKELEQNYYETIESIKKYGGFYIGRYETGGTGVIRKMDYNSSNNSWYQLYKKCDILKGENNNVKTSMIWGSLWDATLRWFIASGEKASNGIEIDNTYLTNWYYARNLGNYYYSEFDYIEKDAKGPVYGQNKKFVTDVQIATGSTKHASINNIYDMAGNLQDCTLESNYYSGRGQRGSAFNKYTDRYNTLNYREKYHLRE